MAIFLLVLSKQYTLLMRLIVPLPLSICLYLLKAVEDLVDMALGVIFPSQSQQKSLGSFNERNLSFKHGLLLQEDQLLLASYDLFDAIERVSLGIFTMNIDDSIIPIQLIRLKILS